MLIDNIRNTLLLFYLLIKDYVSLYYLMECYYKMNKKLNFSLCNNYGIIATHLILSLDKNVFKETKKKKIKNIFMSL